MSFCSNPLLLLTAAGALLLPACETARRARAQRDLDRLFARETPATQYAIRVLALPNGPPLHLTPTP